MAWVVTALFLPGIIGLGYIIHASPHKFACWQELIVVLVVLLFSIAVFTFVWKQFSLRSEAADEIIVMINLVNNLCRNGEYISGLETSALDIKSPYIPGKPWPNFIQDELENARGKGRTRSTWQCTDFISYAAIILALLISVFLVITTTF
ncbi:hypothetical protein ACFLYX_03455 [Chloroflexota bacterium]